MLVNHLRAAFAFALLFAFGSAVVAQDRPAAAPKQTTTEVKEKIHRASQLMNLSVQNAKRDDIGKIHDIVIDAKSGNVRYFAIQFGSTFGFGGKLFAVPYNAVQIRYDSQSNSNFCLFDVSKEQLEKAPGFQSDKWPDFGDQAFTGTIDKFYEVHSQRNTQPQPQPQR